MMSSGSLSNALFSNLGVSIDCFSDPTEEIELIEALLVDIFLKRKSIMVGSFAQNWDSEREEVSKRLNLACTFVDAVSKIKKATETLYT